MAEFCDAELIERIEQHYRELGHDKGWSLFYSPRSTRDGAEVATLGLNPGGGRTQDFDWGGAKAFSNEAGNSYLVERWAGENQSPLQHQVQRLVGLLGCGFERVVSANLVPFRSPTWQELRAQRQSLVFGLSLLDWILASPRLKLVVLFGLGRFEPAVVQTVAGGEVPVEVLATGWGKTQARIYSASRLTIVGLPHLSRYQIFGRPEAKELEARLASALSYR